MPTITETRSLITASPSDKKLRMELANAFAKDGKHKAAELIRVQCILNRDTNTVEKQISLKKMEAALLKEPEVKEQLAGLLGTIGMVTMVDGLPKALETRSSALLTNMAALGTSTIDQLSVFVEQPDDVKAILENPLMQKITTFNVDFDHHDKFDVIHSPNLVNVKTLGITHTGPHNGCLPALFRPGLCDSMPNLTALSIELLPYADNFYVEGVLGMICASSIMPKLEALRILHQIRDADIIKFRDTAASTTPLRTKKLKYLSISRANITTAAYPSLTGPHLENMESLRIDGTAIQDSSLLTLLSNCSQNMKHLCVNSVSTALTAFFVRQRISAKLQTLIIFSSSMVDSVVEVMANNVSLKTLKTLGLYAANITKAAVVKIATSPNFENLEQLAIYSDSIENREEAIRILSTMPKLKKLMVNEIPQPLAAREPDSIHTANDYGLWYDIMAKRYF